MPKREVECRRDVVGRGSLTPMHDSVYNSVWGLFGGQLKGFHLGLDLLSKQPILVNVTL